MHTHASAFGRIQTRSVAFLCLHVHHEHPLQLGVELGGLLLGAAHLRGNVADVIGPDVAVLVAQLRVLGAPCASEPARRYSQSHSHFDALIGSEHMG